MSRHIFPTTRNGLILASLLAAGAGLVHAFSDYVGEPKRWLLVLLTMGLFAAPNSRSPLNIHAWLVATVFIGWAGRYAAIYGISLAPLLVLSFLGASLAVRGGERATDYYLPKTSDENTPYSRAAIRTRLQVSVFLFLVVFVADGFRRSGAWEYTTLAQCTRLTFLFLSAASFAQYLVMQSTDPDLALGSFQRQGFVPAQRWPFLIFLALFGWSPLPRWLLARLGEGSERSLHITAGLLMLLATATFLGALVKLQRQSTWSRRSTRWASFVGGLFLAHSLFAFLLDLGYRIDPLGEGLLTSRAAQGIKSIYLFIAASFLIFLPFVHAKTRLVSRYPTLAHFVAPTAVSIMFFPLAAINGWRWRLPAEVFLFFLTLIIAGYLLRAVVRAKVTGKLYLFTTLGLLVVGAYLDALDADPSKSIYKLFAISLAFVFYALDLYDRATEFKGLASKGP